MSNLTHYAKIITAMTKSKHTMQKSETIVIRVSEELKDRLTKLAESQNRTLSKYIRLKLELHVYNIDNPVKERRVRRSKNLPKLPDWE